VRRRVRSKSIEELLREPRISGTTSTATAKASSSGTESSEARAALRGGVRAAVVRRHHLDVFNVATPIPSLVLDPEIRELHPPVDDRQLVFVRPKADLFPRPAGPAVAVRSIAVPFLKERLVLAFQLVVEDHSANTSAIVPKAFSRTNVCAEQLRVMRKFTRLDNVGVERLANVVTGPAMILEKSSAAPR